MSSAGQEAVELAAVAGLVLDPWQQLVLDVMLAERSDGRWSAFEVGLLVARQNGKGAILEARELAGLFLFGERLILHSAHEFKTAQEAFIRIKGLIDNNDDLRRRVRTIRTSHGDEGIELLDGRRLRFVARSRSSGRGFSGDTVILDEAQELPRAAMGALLPTMSARPNPQVIYTGTVPDIDNDAEHFTSVRDRGRAGGDPFLAWVEWSPTMQERVDLDDRDGWAEANPAMGFRVTDEFIGMERASLGDEQFARERLSVWADSGVAAVIPTHVWAKLADPSSTLVDPVAFAVDVTPDRSWSSICAAGQRADGLPHVEVVEHRSGTGWVVERLIELAAAHRTVAVALDPAGPVGSFQEELEQSSVPLVTVNVRELGQACGLLYDDAMNGRLRHLDQPDLNTALRGARKRPLGDAWAWHRSQSSVDISPLVASTLALWAWMAADRRPMAVPDVVLL